MTIEKLESLQEEASELDLKLGDLLSFIDSPMFAQLSIGQRELMKKQEAAMTDYIHILFARLYLLASSLAE